MFVLFKLLDNIFEVHSFILLLLLGEEGTALDVLPDNLGIILIEP